MRLELRLLGNFRVFLAGEAVTGFESVKVRALLAYLASESRHPLRRETLAALLWPDWPQQSAMNNLRYALADLRKNITDRDAHPTYLLISRESIQINPEADIWIDVREFESAIQESNFENQKSAIALYQGEFLEGVSLPDGPAFEQWVLARRQHLHRLALQTFFNLAEACAQTGDFKTALPYARRQVELEPWHEPGQQQLMRLLALDGQRSASLAQYEACRKALADGLQVEPSQETTRLYTAIRDENLEGISHWQVSKTPSLAELPPESGEAPFKGLQYFDTPDADLFFGREALTARLVRHIREMSEVQPTTEEPGCCNFLAVVGASGSGKSSVMRAGVVPALLKGKPLPDGTLPPPGSPNWRIHIFTPTAHPLEALAASLTRESESLIATTRLIDDLAQDTRSLHLFAMKDIPGDPTRREAGKLLLVVDQFEELFTLCRSETERQVFLENLLTAVERGGPVLVVIILRADFYAHCAQHPGLRQALATRQEYIGSMDFNELRRAIEEPARQKGWQFAPGLVDLILRDVGVSEDHPAEPGALPLLEHALLETWQRRAGRSLTLSGYQDAGGVHGAIAHTAESVYSKLTPEQQAQAQRIFVRLTALGEGTQDTRRRVLLSELISNSPGVGTLLNQLADARLITMEEGFVEVAHEALIREWPVLRQWLNEDREGLRLHRHLTESAQAWAELDRNPGDLYRGARLTLALEWVARPDNAASLNALEQEFLAASQAQTERESAEQEAQRQRELEAALKLARTQRQRTNVLAVGFTVAILLTAAALWFLRSANIERQRANQQVRISLSRQLAAQSVAHHEDALDLALLLASEARNVADTVEAQGSLLAGLHHDPRLWISIFVEPYPIGLHLSPDHKILASEFYEGNTILWNISNPAAPAQLGRLIFFDAYANVDMVFSLNNQFSVMSNNDANFNNNSISFQDLSNLENISEVDEFLRTDANMVKKLALSPDSKVLATGHIDGTIFLWDLANPATPRKLGQLPTTSRSAIQSLAFSPDGKILASGDVNNSINLWDISDPAAPRLFGLPLSAHTKFVSALSFSPTHPIMASGSEDGKVILWNIVNPSAPVQVGQIILEKAITTLGFASEGEILAVSTADGSFSAWDISDPKTPVVHLIYPPGIRVKKQRSALALISS